MNICYITMYYDIGRDKWKSFKRTFEEYLEGFLPFIELFRKEKELGFLMKN